MKVLVATAMYPTPESPAFGSFVRSQVEALRQAGVDVEVLVLKAPIRKLKYPAGVLQLRKRLADTTIDLVHAHYSFVGAVARMQRKVPVVVSFCGDDLLGTVDRKGRETLFSHFVVAGGRVLSRYVDAIIVKTDEMAARLKRKDVHVIPNEVDFELFRPIPRDRARAELGLDADKKLLLFAANPQIPVKRFDLAKELVDYLRQHDPSIELLVVQGETQQRLMLYMNACDVLVFPSFQEGSPNVVKQAMACNLPIVATDVGSVRQILGNTRDCYICAPNVLDFAGRSSEVLRTRPRTDGRQHVAHLAGPIVAGQIIAVYEQTLRKFRCHQRNHQPQPASLPGKSV
jgi:teichuronic acid biosynthesis glycosyltransferase TuaC